MRTSDGGATRAQGNGVERKRMVQQTVVWLILEAWDARELEAPYSIRDQKEHHDRGISRADQSARVCYRNVYLGGQE